MVKKTDLTKILDVGCGGHPRGTVNCDLFIGKSPHTKFFVHKTENFVKCDAHYLPFRDSSFHVVHSSHTLEHLRHPFLGVNEFKRVTKRFVCIRIPNSGHVRLEDQGRKHLYGWDKSTFKNILCEVAFRYVKVYHASQDYVSGKILDRIYLLKRLLSFIMKKLFPMELIAICKK